MESSSSSSLPWANAPSKSWTFPCILVVIGITFLTFHGILENEFVNWDDPFFVTDNPSIQKLDGPHLREIFTTTEAGAYTPLSRLSMALDYAWWGSRPEGFHLTALLLHALNAGMVFMLARILLRRMASCPSAHSIDLGASVAALLFALHPMSVESVAWVAERRDVLSLFFVLLATLAYFRHLTALESGCSSFGWYFSFLTLFILALLTKTVVVTVPLVLLLLDVTPLRRIPVELSLEAGRRALRCLFEKAPLLLISLGMGMGTIQVLRSSDKLLGTADAGWETRVAQSAVATASYVRKTMLPIALNPLDPLDHRYDFSQPEVWWCFSLALGTTLLLIGMARRRPGLLLTWIATLILIAPFLGIAQSGLQLTADRYTYLASIPLCVALGGVFQHRWAAPSSVKRIRLTIAAITLLILGMLAFLTTRQEAVWKDSASLWTHSLSINPDNPVAWNNLGVVRADRKEYSLAIPCYRNVLKRVPDHVGAWFNLANACNLQGNAKEAVTAYQMVLKFDRFHRGAHYNFAGVLVRLQDFPQALSHYQRAMELQATPETEFQIGRCLELQLHPTAALQHYRAAARDGCVDAWIEWAELLRKQGHPDESMTVLREALSPSGDARLQIAFAEGVLLMKTPNPREMEQAQNLLAALNTRLQGQSQKVREILDRLQARRSPKIAPEHVPSQPSR